MRIQSKITLTVTGLLSLVLVSFVSTQLWMEQSDVRKEEGRRIDALMEGVMRITQ